MRKIFAVTLAVAVMLMAVTATQAKASPAPSAIDQYVEQIPTAVGQHALDGDPHTSAGPALSPAVRARLRSLQRGEATQLEEISTAPELGAPQQSLPHPRESVSAPASPAAALSAATTDDGGARLLWLAILLAGITAFTVSRAVHGRERRDPAA